MRIVPENNLLSSTSSISNGVVAASAPGLQDILRTGEGPLSIASKINGRHPLESRIANWEETQHNTRMEQYRRIFGAGEPIKRQMDLSIVEATDFKPSLLGGSANVHRNILLNKDTSIDWEDIYDGQDGLTRHADFHSELERKLGM